jgi:FMN phosphatase YigB (HAD superfamily)
MVMLGLMVGLSTASSAQCINAVFFDLGDTLVEDPGTGLFVLRAGASETIASLQGLGVPIGIITNVPAGWDRSDLEAILEEPEFLDEFDVLVLSSEAPAPKPSPLIYSHAHDQLSAPAPPITETAFVGETLSEIADSEINPTSGARAVGMVGIHLSDAAPSPLADFTITTDDLPGVALLVANSCPVFQDGFESGDVGAWQ